MNCVACGPHESFNVFCSSYVRPHLLIPSGFLLALRDSQVVDLGCEVKLPPSHRLGPAGGIRRPNVVFIRRFVC